MEEKREGDAWPAALRQRVSLCGVCGAVDFDSDLQVLYVSVPGLTSM
jgi:hypothetical protein